MSFWYGDTFDGYASDQFSRWNGGFGGPFAGINIGGGRHGTNALGFFDNGRAIKVFQVSAGWISGFAFRTGVFNGLMYSYYADNGVGNVVRLATLSTNSLGGFTLQIGNNDPVASSMYPVYFSSSWEHLQFKITTSGGGTRDSPEDMVVSCTVLVNNATIGLDATDVVHGLTMSGVNVMGFTLVAGGATWAFDDYYIINTTDGIPPTDFVGDLRGLALFPDGAGAEADWTASVALSQNFQMVDENPDDGDTTYVHTKVLGAFDSYRFPDVSLPPGAHIYGVQENVVARKDNAGSRSMATLCRPTTASFLGPSISLGETYDTYQKMWNQNPDTNLDWTQAEFNAAEWGQECTA